MVSVFLQSIPINSKKEFPFRVVLLNSKDTSITHFTFRPNCALSSKLCHKLDVDRIELLNAPPFCEIAEQLIESLGSDRLIFFNSRQFRVVKGLFKTIGFNFAIQPSLYFSGSSKDLELQDDLLFTLSRKHNTLSIDFTVELLEIISKSNGVNAEFRETSKQKIHTGISQLISKVENAPGVYFFYDSEGAVIYVGKAKNLRKRLQSHFSKKEIKSTIEYSKVADITVEYTGNDIIAQLVESENIKKLQPAYNSQQINDAAPFIINIGMTAKGVSKASIVRKDYIDNLPEQYFNRESVKKALEKFCTENQLCRKHCGLEKIKGPCTRSRVRKLACVCSGDIDIDTYNEMFDLALKKLRNRKTRHIYKLPGRSKNEDSFIYVLNGVYQGYGFIEKEDFILNENDILSRMSVQKNNYDTNRIVFSLMKKSKPIEI